MLYNFPRQGVRNEKELVRHEHDKLAPKRLLVTTLYTLPEVDLLKNKVNHCKNCGIVKDR